MTTRDILVSAAQNQTARFRKWLSFILDAECDLDPQGNIREENLHDGAGITFAGLTERDDGYTSGVTTDWVVSKYYAKYWDLVTADQLPSPVGEVVANYAVNCGVKKAVLFLQWACQDYGQTLVTDGIIGDNTRKAAWAVPNTNDLALAVIAKGDSYYKNLAAENSNDSRFLQGWLNRDQALKNYFC